VLSGELELAGRPGRSREELEGAVARAGEEAARLARITEQLLFLARADEDLVSARRRPTDMRKLLASSAEQAAVRAREAGLSCDVQAPAGLVADLDPDRIREAVDNLVDNALRFAPAGTSIVVAARAANGDLTVEVTDHGPGFPAEFLPHAFARFRRPDSGRACSDGGAGLGLAIVSAIAYAHGGRATVGNLRGGGAVVALELPGAVDRAGRGQDGGRQ
jgi:two-component system, OmpR family, sensor kinase